MWTSPRTLDVSEATREVEMRCNTSFVELAGPIVAGALLAALLVAAVALGPIAYQRWF